MPTASTSHTAQSDESGSDENDIATTGLEAAAGDGVPVANPGRVRWQRQAVA